MRGNKCKDIEIVLSTVTSSLGNTFVIFVYVAFRQIAHCLKYLEMKILEKILSLFCPSWRYSVCTNLKNKFPFMNVALLLSFVVGLSLAWAFKIWHDKGISQYKILDMHLNNLNYYLARSFLILFRVSFYYFLILIRALQWHEIRYIFFYNHLNNKKLVTSSPYCVRKMSLHQQSHQHILIQIVFKHFIQLSCNQLLQITHSLFLFKGFCCMLGFEHSFSHKFLKSRNKAYL